MKKPYPCLPVRSAPVSPVCKLDMFNTPFAKPDLAIYNPIQIFSQGGLPTWDNPDMETYRGSGSDKQIRLVDRIKARIRNLSNIAPATNALVHCDIGAFGIGTSTTRLQTQMVNVAPSQQLEVSFPLPAQILNGEQRIAAHITIELAGDVNPINNVGSQIAFGGYSSVLGRNPVFEFPVVNTTGQTIQCSLSTLENQLSAVVEPQSFLLDPLEQVQVKLSCRVPDSVHPQPPAVQRMDVTVICLKEDGNLYGGITLFIIVDD